MASSKPAVPDPTEIAGRYVIDKKLGAGAFGTVYKAKDKILGRMVAIKTIRLESLAAQGAGLEEMQTRFEREAQVSAQIKHPNIVTIHDLGNADGLSYLAMEFIDGVGLEKIIARAGCPWSARPAWPPRWPTPWISPTRPASCTATSSPPTSWWRRATG